jgi:hypothetical protein
MLCKVSNQAIHIDEGVRLLDAFYVTMVPFRVMVVVQHRWDLLAAPDER